MKTERSEYETLAAKLKERICGEVRFDAGSRALYSTDASNYRQIPIGVVVPKNRQDVIETVAACRAAGAPILARGGGTSLAGQCCNAAVVLDMSKYLNRILEIDPVKKTARIEPGVVLDDLRNAAEAFELTFGPDPSTHNHCTLGGMIGNNSCGVHSVMAGKTDENVEALEILTYEGLQFRVGKTDEREFERILREGGRRAEIYSGLEAFRKKYAALIREKFPDIPRRVSGYNLPQLLPENGFHVARALVGSECTCMLVLEAEVRLVSSPQKRTLLVLGYPDVYSAGDHVPEILESGPIGLEGLDEMLVEDMKKSGIHPEDVRLLPPGKGWLLAEFGGSTKDDADGQANRLIQRLRGKEDPPSFKIFDNPEEEKLIWKVRESGLGATARVPGEKDTWEGWEDSAVPPARLGEYLRALRKLFEKYGYACALYGHFGQGCVHTRIDFDLFSGDGIRKYRSFMNEAADLVVSLGGSFSGEHGDGQSRAELLPKMFGPELIESFREFKSLWDPEWKMNPGKIVNPYRMDENLRYGTGYHPWKPETHFKFPGDDGLLARGVQRCVGVGECRRKEGGTMCPSYRATLEEKHSTRGRSRLLFEMMDGHFFEQNWRNDAVKEALDLCLACKGCKSDCPVNVDMATYKAEFLSHYYAGRLRPRSAYSMGWIPLWSRIGGVFPGLANFFTQTPWMEAAAKAAAGISQQRKIPPFAGQNFRTWYQKRTAKKGGKKILLWTDTFNNYFYPAVLKSAAESLERLGFEVLIPKQNLCCGRPFYDYGFLDQAKHALKKILTSLEEEISLGIPIVALEPSCAAVFRDEMLNLFPGHKTAERLKNQVFLLNEFLLKNRGEIVLPWWKMKAVVHGHCHQKAVMGMNADQEILKMMGLDFEILDSGCCGMAGSFGFEAEHYDISVKCGENMLLPAVRNAELGSLIIADGFSCREQILQLTQRKPLHMAQVLERALAERVQKNDEIKSAA